MRKEHLGIQEKLKQYALLVSPMLATSAIANAQVIYHEINPDIVYKDSIPGDNYATPHFLDLDNDGKYDVEFAVFSSAQSKNGPNKVNLAAARQGLAKGNALMGYTNLFSASFCSTPLPVYCLSALNTNREIGPGDNFWAVPDSNSLGTLVRFFKNISPPNNFLGQWNNLADRYIGVRFLGGDGGTHYGWIRLDVSKLPASITLKDYAYEMQGNTAIRAGDKGVTGISSSPSSTIDCNIFSSGDLVNIVINQENPSKARLNVTNVLGQTVLTKSITSQTTQFNLKQFGAGVYIVSLVYNGHNFSNTVICE